MKILLTIFIWNLLNLLAVAQTSNTPALKVRGEDYVDAKGTPVKFWGVNLVAFYPDHERADAVAANLESLQVNLVRPHHLLRPGLDWNPAMVSGALATYKETSREIDPAALDSFDYLNSALGRHGIYLALSLHQSRLYRPGDVDILKSDDRDRDAWMAAMKELNGMNWKMSRDPYKMLPTLDERVALLNEEFVKKLLTHVNPYTGLTYAADPQVLTIEVLNEACTEYAVICGNRFPEYWQSKLIDKWNVFAQEAGIDPGDLYKPANAKAKETRAQFLRKLDEDYFERIKAVVRTAGCEASITFSNLWEGDNALEMHSRLADQIENHSYMDPLVVRSFKDGFYDLGKRALSGKPFFVGELNQAEGDENVRRQSPARSMLPLAAGAYGSLQNWSGIVWFAWTHGDPAPGENGWSAAEGRVSNIGAMQSDGVMIDHLRTAGMIFRRGLAQKSKEPLTLWIDEPFTAADYDGLMRGKTIYPPGWQNIHEIRKSFGPVPAEQKEALWITQPPSNPLVSDTEEIVKDIDRRQLTLSAPQAEGFSGYLDHNAPAGLQHLALEGEGFATVILVAEDEKSLSESSSLVISRTGLNARNVETKEPLVKLRGLKAPGNGEHWTVRLTRPRPAAELIKEFLGAPERRLAVAEDGSIALPFAAWHECELHLQ